MTSEELKNKEIKDLRNRVDKLIKENVEQYMIIFKIKQAFNNNNICNNMQLVRRIKEIIGSDKE